MTMQLQSSVLIGAVLLILFVQDAVGRDQVRCFQCQYLRMKRGSGAEVTPECLTPDQTDPRLTKSCKGLCLKTYVETENLEYLERACVSGCREGGLRQTQYGEGTDHCCEGDYCNHGNAYTPSVLTITMTTGLLVTLLSQRLL